MPEKLKKKAVTIRLTKDEVTAIEVAAYKVFGSSRMISAWIRMAIRAYLSKAKKEAA